MVGVHVDVADMKVDKVVPEEVATAIHSCKWCVKSTVNGASNQRQIQQKDLLIDVFVILIGNRSINDVNNCHH
jgi:hypothetical protein